MQQQYESKPETYDEWRAFLGLVEVSDAVKRAASRRELRQHSDTFTASLEELVNGFIPAMQQMSDAMDGLAKRLGRKGKS